jgi:hypothetical protein
MSALRKLLRSCLTGRLSQDSSASSACDLEVYEQLIDLRLIIPLAKASVISVYHAAQLAQ